MEREIIIRIERESKLTRITERGEKKKKKQNQVKRKRIGEKEELLGKKFFFIFSLLFSSC